MKNENVYRARQRSKAERQPAFKKMLAAVKESRESQVMRILKSDAPVTKSSDGRNYKGRPPVYSNNAPVGSVANFVKTLIGVPFVRA